MNSSSNADPGMTALLEQVATLVGEVAAPRDEDSKVHEANATLAVRDKEQAVLIQALQIQVAQRRAEMSKCRCGRRKRRDANPPNSARGEPARRSARASDKPVRESRQTGLKRGLGRQFH